MKIGILQADSVLAQFQEAHGSYPGMIEDVLGRAAKSLGVSVSFSTYDVEHGQFPAHTDDCSGYVITGSKMSVYDDAPWIQDLGAYVRKLDEAKARTVGLCFGHQLIAEFLGGKTMSAEVGWGVGIHLSRVVKPAWFMDPQLPAFSLIVSHKDQVVEMPETAELHASSEFCPNSMFTIGEHILAMQGHPEFNRDYSLTLIQHREEILGPETFNRGVASLDGDLSRDQVARWIVRFLKGQG